MVLLAGCGLMVKTMIRLNAVDPGFRPTHLLTARLLLEGDAWREPARRMAFLDDVTSRLLALPGVLNVGLTLSLPIDGSYWDGPVTVADKPMRSPGDVPSAAFVPVSPDYFDTAGMPMLRGRRFDRTDSAEAPRTAIVNEGLASRFWPGEDPIGKRLRFGLPGPEKGWEGDWREVVGVVGDVRLNGITVSAPPQVYLPLAQLPGDSAALVVRTASDPAQLATAVQDTIQAVRPDVPVASLRSMDDLMRSAVAYQRLSAIILTVFAGVALVLAAVGVYGVAANAVTDRTREIGLRMVLGARSASVVRLIVSEGVGTVLIGSVVGVVIAVLGSRAIEHLLFEVTPYDPATFGVVVAILLLTTLLACAIPARRAVRVDPVRALSAD
jgi:putative ABC transport system permease protein